MTLRAVLIGGPLDGHETAPRTLPFVWVSPAGGQVRVFDRPGAGRLLYRAEGIERLVFAEYTHTVCPGCDLVQPTEEPTCALCGQVLIPL